MLDKPKEERKRIMDEKRERIEKLREERKALPIRDYADADRLRAEARRPKEEFELMEKYLRF